MFVLDDGSLKVVDFGIAHVEASDLTDTGAMLGTPAYMSPEQCLGTQVDHRSDLFSAGVILYQLLTGDKPFTGSVTTIIQKVLRQEPLPPSELNPTLSPASDRVVARAMSKKPEARFESARQFAEAIKAAHSAERAHEEEARKKAAEAEEHAHRAAEERSRAEAARRSEDERREAERIARAEADAQRLAEERARREAGERTVAITKPAPNRTPAITAAILVAIAVLGTVLYSRYGTDEKALKADAVRVAAEMVARDGTEKRSKAEALDREETGRRSKVEADTAKKEAEARQESEIAVKVRTDEEAKKSVEEKAKLLALMKDDVKRMKMEAAAKKAVEEKAQSENEARRKAEELAKQQAEAEVRRKAEALAKQQAEEKAVIERNKESLVAAEKAAQVAREKAELDTRARFAQNFDGIWYGALSYGALNFTEGARGSVGAFRYDVAMTVMDRVATIRRSNVDVIEELTGRIAGGSNSTTGDVSLNGEGYWRDKKSGGWLYSLSGTFIGNSFKAKGAMRTRDGGRVLLLRQCELDLAR